MKKTIVSLVLCGSLAATAALPAAAVAKPGGCLKYGAAGAIAGHATHHGAMKGFLAGCAAGMYRRHLYNKQQKQLKANPSAAPAAPAPDATAPKSM